MPLRSCRPQVSVVASLLALVALLAACSDSPVSPSPLAAFQPQIVNVTDSFQLQATGLTTVSSSLTYTWQDTGTRATINHSTSTTAGTAHLTIRDANGVLMYDKDLSPSLNEPTATGTPGTWTVTLTVVNYSGSLNFSATKL